MIIYVSHLRYSLKIKITIIIVILTILYCIFIIHRHVDIFN